MSAVVADLVTLATRFRLSGLYAEIETVEAALKEINRLKKAMGAIQSIAAKGPSIEERMGVSDVLALIELTARTCLEADGGSDEG